MAREIKGKLFKINIFLGVDKFVECENLNNLFGLILDLKETGTHITNVSEILKDGRIPRIAVNSNEDFNIIGAILLP